MIKSVSSAEKRVSSAMHNGMTAYNNAKATNKAVMYADSFTRHAVESTPMLLSLTAVGALMDKSLMKIPFKQAFVHNMKNYFAPVIIFSSAFLAYLENKKVKK